MQLFAIQCTFKPRKYSKPEHGIAICSDPNTPVTFVRADGMPYLGKGIWSYDLIHHMPWAVLGELQ